AVLLEERLPFERARKDRHVEVIHRSRPVVDANLGVGQLLANQIGQRCVVDHDFKRGDPPVNVCANPRASPRVSGRRLALWLSALVIPLARMMPLAPIRIAGTPVARNGPISMVKLFCSFAAPRKKAASERIRLFMGGPSTAPERGRPGPRG